MVHSSLLVGGAGLSGAGPTDSDPHHAGWGLSGNAWTVGVASGFGGRCGFLLTMGVGELKIGVVGGHVGRG